MTEQKDTRPAWAIRAEQIARAKKGGHERRHAREGFWLLLVVAAVCAAGAVFVYLNEDRFYAQGDFGGWMYLILLMSLILGAFYAMLAFRVTSLGAKLLDMTPMRTNPQAVEHIGFGFDTTSASSEKRAASARLQARQARRKYAKRKG